MIGTMLTLFHFILNKLGIVEDMEEDEEYDPDCVSHDSGPYNGGFPNGGSRNGGSPNGGSRNCGSRNGGSRNGGSRNGDSPRQSGGTDEIPTAFSGYQHDSELPFHFSTPAPLIFRQYLIEEENDDVTEPSNLPLTAFSPELFLEPRDDATALAEYGSVGCEFALEPLRHLVLNSDAILESGCTGGTTGAALLNSVHNLINSNMFLNIDISPSQSTSGEESKPRLTRMDNPEDFPASGDGSSSPVEPKIDTEKTKSDVEEKKVVKTLKNTKTVQRSKSPPMVMEEVISAILGFDESNAGVGEPELMMLGERMMDTMGSLTLATSEGDSSVGNGNLFAMASYVPCVVTGISRDPTEKFAFGSRNRQQLHSSTNLYLIEEESG